MTQESPLAFAPENQIYQKLSAELIPESSPIITRRLFYESAIHNNRTQICRY